MTITECIIDLLTQGWTSRADVFREIGSLDLPKRVSELRRQGIEIESQSLTRKNRYGRTIHYNVYRIKEEQK